ncbi:helix-turn-helix transcriptional regulator [Streptomyces sp. NPDC048629]|uniref:helix-turn-helix domain-containing protein n=1 Tax=Streptomyces sp. NPDC048629 TaxID=3154824 RepID=UPI00342E54CD
MAPRDPDRLAQAVHRRRTELGLPLKRAANMAGVSPDTWRRVERAEPVRDLSFAKMDPVLQWATGSCIAVLEGRSAVPTKPSESNPDVSISTIPPEALTEEARDVVKLATLATAKGMTIEEVLELSERIVADLKKHGLLGGS